MTLSSGVRESLISNLDPVQRLLITSDGTLTHLLEAAALESISLTKLEQCVRPAAGRDDLLEVEYGELLMDRKVLLRGERSGTNYVYAESFIVFDRLPAPLRQALLISNTPMGLLWRKHRLEVFKELVDLRRQLAGWLARYFEVPRDVTLLVRTHRLIAGGRPVMLIREHFSPAPIVAGREPAPVTARGRDRVCAAG
jgi:chorismate-pyruvate lyase